MHGSFFFLYVQEVVFSLKPDHPDILSIYVYLSLFITISLFISKSLTGKFQGDRNGDPWSYWKKSKKNTFYEHEFPPLHNTLRKNYMYIL